MKIQYLVIFILYSFIITACNVFFQPTELNGEQSELDEIYVTSTEFNISWDYSTASFLESEIDDLSFILYAREFSSFEWMELGQKTLSEGLFFSLDSSIITPGRYYFAVKATYGEIDSNLHTSQDSNASPDTGWLIHWDPNS